jgi:hypothetical protein
MRNELRLAKEDAAKEKELAARRFVQVCDETKSAEFHRQRAYELEAELAASRERADMLSAVSDANVLLRDKAEAAWHAAEVQLATLRAEMAAERETHRTRCPEAETARSLNDALRADNERLRGQNHAMACVVATGGNVTLSPKEYANLQAAIGERFGLVARCESERQTGAMLDRVERCAGAKGHRSACFGGVPPCP